MIPKQVLSLQLDNPMDTLFLFEKVTGACRKIDLGPTKSQKIFIDAHAINGRFKIGKNNMDKFEIEFIATSLKEYTCAIAYMSNGIWRIKYLLKFTPNYGVRCFPAAQLPDIDPNQAYKIPAELSKTTALILGIGTEETLSEVSFRTFTTSIEGYVKYNVDRDEIIFSDTPTGHEIDSHQISDDYAEEDDLVNGSNAEYQIDVGLSQTSIVSISNEIVEQLIMTAVNY